MKKDNIGPFWYLMAFFLVYKPLTKIVERIFDYTSAEIINWILLSAILAWGMVLLYQSGKYKNKKRIAAIYLLIFGVYTIWSVLIVK
ncbi:MAG: hypothetical protein KDC49_07635 [Saprospiraceae bacterium]|nr:hypothetical protein [Saprospiraceae bacterium]